MRALLLALLCVSSVSFAGETIVSGDSDHTYMPVWSEREVLLHKFSYLPTTFPSPTTYLAWNVSSSTYNANCIQQFGNSQSTGMESTNRACTLPENAFRAPRMFRLTRVVYRTGAAGTHDTGGGSGFADSLIRVVTISTSGTITEIGTSTALVTGVGNLTTWDLAADVSTGTGVGLQMKPVVSAALDDFGASPVIELWGIWK